MCISAPWKVVELTGSGSAVVAYGDVTQEVSLALVYDIVIGDSVIVSGEYVVRRLEPAEAEETLALLTQLPHPTTFVQQAHG